jgi:hypothetical protein
MTEHTKPQVFFEELSPLLDQVKRIAQEHNIAYYLLFQIDSPEAPKRAIETCSHGPETNPSKVFRRIRQVVQERVVNEVRLDDIKEDIKELDGTPEDR